MNGKSNILHIIETGGPGGAETVFLNIVKNLDRSRFNSIAVVLKTGWLYDQLIKNSIETRIISSRHSWDLVFLYRLIRTCQELKIDLIHSHLADINVYSCLTGSIAKIPRLVTYHNEILLPGRVNRFNILKLFIIRKLATKIVMVADCLRSDFRKNAKFPDKKLLTIYNGIEFKEDKSNFETQTKKKDPSIGRCELVVGNVANIRAPKGHRYLIDAAEQICKELPEVKFLLIGEEGKGKLKTEIEEQISRLHLQDNVQILGFRNDVQKLLREIDVFVLSSISEGFPLSVVEAMAASKPVVATKVGGIPELICHGENGFLVPARNPAMLAERTLTLLKDKKLRESMGRKARMSVEEKFSIRKMVESYQDLYEELLSRMPC